MALSFTAVSNTMNPLSSPLRGDSPKACRRRFAALLLLGWLLVTGWSEPASADNFYWSLQSGEGYFTDLTKWKDQSGATATRVIGTNDAGIIRGPGVVRIDTQNVPSGTILGFWVGDASPQDQWPYAPVGPGAGNVLQTSGTINYSSWFIIGRAGSPGESTYDMQGGSLAQVGGGQPFVLGNNAGYGSLSNPTRGTLLMSNNASIMNNHMFTLGDNIGSTGTLVMRDTAVVNSNEVDIGWYGGVGSISLTGSASIISRNYSVMGKEGGVSSITMGGNSLYSGNYGHVGGINGGSSTWVLNDDARITFASWLNFGEVNATSRLTMNGRSSITASYYVDFGWGNGSDSQGVLNEDARLTIANNLNIGVNGSNQGLLIVNDRATVSANYLNVAGGAANAGGQLTLNGSSSVTINNMVNFGGEGGTGRLVINGGIFRSANASMGYNGGRGFATVNSGTWAANGPLSIGMSGSGSAVLTVAGGLVTSTGTTILGRDAGSSGTVNVSSGTWTQTGPLRVGGSGSGTMTMTGGAVDATLVTIGHGSGSRGQLSITGGAFTNDLTYIGNGAGTYGLATLSSGTLAPRQVLLVGVSGTGILDMTGGTTRLTSNYTGAYIGFSAGSTGLVAVGGGEFDARGSAGNGTLIVGNSGVGNLRVAGGSVRAGTARVAANSGGRGSVYVSSGSLNATSTLEIGYINGSIGELTLDGGAVSVGGTGYSFTTIGFDVGSLGQVNVRSGTFVPGSQITIGNSGTGVVSVSGGNVTTSFAFLGANAGSTGTLALTGGTVGISSLSMGLSGTGTVTVGGGRLNASSISLGSNAGSTGTFRVTTGTVTADSMSVGNRGAGRVTIDGGRLDTYRDTLIGSGTGGTGTVIVNGGTWSSWGAVTMGSVGAGSLVVGGGGLVGIDDRLEVGSRGSVTVNPGGTLRLGSILWFTGTSFVSGSWSNSAVIGNLGVDGILVFGRQVPTTYAGVISGSGAVMKTGTAALTLTGIHTFTGAYTVSGGELKVQGATAAGSRMLVSATATLSGTGTLGGQVTLQGNLAPGNSAGTITFADNLILASGARVTWELAANSANGGTPGLFDQVVVGGDLTFEGPTAVTLSFTTAGSLVDWNDPFWGVDHAWTLFDAADGRTTTGVANLAVVPADWFDSLGVRFSALRAGGFSVAQQGNDVVLTFTAVPEPTTVALVSIGATVLLVRRIRRQLRRCPSDGGTTRV